jgi:hypothetical protein
MAGIHPLHWPGLIVAAGVARFAARSAAVSSERPRAETG